MTSIACLYPGYLHDVQLFWCPSTEDGPALVLNVPEPIGDRDGDGVITETDVIPGQEHLWNQRNYTVTDCSYGYDCRMSRRPHKWHAIAADMDGGWGLSRDTATQNHGGGQNVLYVDGSVKWISTNYGSNDMLDNIFAEDPWHADTDSFVSADRITSTRWNEQPRYDHGLTISYDAYPDLHPSK